MSQQTSRFFVTRHRANILQDLYRRCEQAGSISVLYGVSGVGKSRLLQQFAKNLDAGQKCLHLCLDQSDRFYAEGNAAASQPLDDFIHVILPNLPAGSILLIDQFEHMKASISRDLFDFWLRSAEERKLKLVIALASERLAAFKHQLEGLSLPIQSVEVVALTYFERLEFLRVHCCSDMQQQVVHSPDLKKALKASGGLFPALLDILQRHPDMVVCKGHTPGIQIRRYTRWSIPLLAVLLGTGVMVVLVSPLWQQVKVESVLPMHSATQAELITNAATKKPPVLSVPKPDQVDMTPLKAQDKPVDANRLPSESKDGRKDLVAPTESASDRNDRAAPKTVVKVDDLLMQRLNATRQWLAQEEGNAFSIQIMTVIDSDATRRSLQRYLKKLDKAGVAADQIRVFPIQRGRRKMLGVLYGRFIDSKSAKASIRQLPAVLKADRPMIRTIAGIQRDLQQKQN